MPSQCPTIAAANRVKTQNVRSIPVNFFCFLAMSVTFAQLQTLSGHESSPWAVDVLRESDFVQERWLKA
jgi:hypothetical protein